MCTYKWDGQKCPITPVCQGVPICFSVLIMMLHLTCIDTKMVAVM